MRLLWKNLADTATLSASPALVATLPVSHLQDPTRARVARTSSTADQQILGDLPSQSTVTCLVLWRHNLSPGATIRLQLYDGAGQTGALTYDSGAVAAYDTVPLGDLDFGVTPLADNVYAEWGQYHTVFYFSAAQTRSFRLTLSDALNADGYLQASRLMLGSYYTGSCGPSYGGSIDWQETTTQERTDGGTLRSDPAEPYRSLSIPLDWVTDADRPHLLEARRYCGLRRDVWISLYPGDGGTIERDFSFIGKFSAGGELVHTNYGLYGHSLQIEES